MKEAERNRHYEEDFHKRMLGDYPSDGPNPPTAEYRIANALEYIAFQLGRIRMAVEAENDRNGPERRRL